MSWNLARRPFLKYSGLLSIAMALGFLPSVSEAKKIKVKKKPKSKYDISYIWLREQNQIFDYMDKVGKVLDLKDAKKLKILRKRSGLMGLIGDVNLGHDSALRLRDKQNKRLKKARLELSNIHENFTDEEQHYVVYGVGPNLEAQIGNLKVVERELNLVGKLAIGDTFDGKYALIYEYLGSKRNRGIVAEKHNDDLKPVNISASISKKPYKRVKIDENLLKKTVIKEEEKVKWDVTLFWSSKLNSAIEYMEKIEEVLDYKIARKLRVVRGRSGNYGIVYDLNSDRRSAFKLASSLTKDLKKADLDRASIIKDIGYFELYNVVYGKGPNLNVQINNYHKIAEFLGPNVTRKLVIEKCSDGEYALVYQRISDNTSSDRIARAHRKKFEKYRKKIPRSISASIIRVNNNELMYGESNYINDRIKGKIEPKAKPKKMPEKHRPPLPSSLERKLEGYINNLRHKKILKTDEHTSWSAYDFTTGEKLVSINEDVPRQCASMVKPFVALAYFHQVEKGKLRYGKKSKRHLRRMIQKSSNYSTNWVMRQIGGPRKVNKILKNKFKKIFKQTKIVEYIPRGGRTYRNEASAHDYSRFLYNLWEDNLINRNYSRKIRRLMALPNRDRVYNGAKMVPTGTSVINKTGSTAMLCGDMAILLAKGKDGKRYPYTLIGIIEKKNRASGYSTWIHRKGNVIREVSNIVYTDMKRRHNLV